MKLLETYQCKSKTTLWFIYGNQRCLLNSLEGYEIFNKLDYSNLLQGWIRTGFVTRKLLKEVKE